MQRGGAGCCGPGFCHECFQIPDQLGNEIFWTGLQAICDLCAGASCSALECSSHTPCAEIPARFLVRVPVALQMRELLDRAPGERCLGLFAAADALKLGHVSGVPPLVFVRKLPRSGFAASEDWDMLAAFPEGTPDIIVRQAPWPESLFRGATNHDGLLTADAIQVWLDVSNHRPEARSRLN